MNKLKWKIDKLDLEFKIAWRIARTISPAKVSENFLLTLSDGEDTVYGEISPNSRYGAKERDVFNEFNRFISLNPTSFTHDSLIKFLKENEFCNSFSFGVESAFVHLQCKKKKIRIYEYFNLNKPKLMARTNFSVPIMEIENLKDFIRGLNRFESLKIKVNQETGFATLKEITKVTDQRLRIDANEAWDNYESFIEVLKFLDDKNVEFIEQPFPAHCKDEYIKLKNNSKFPIIADESVEHHANFEELTKMFHGINVKLMKAGSYSNAISLLKEAKKNNMKTMIGCMVESSLGIWGAYELSSLADYLDLDGFMLVKNDPFKLLQEKNGYISLL